MYVFFFFFDKIKRNNSFFFFFQAEDGIRDVAVTGVQTCALPIWSSEQPRSPAEASVALERGAAPAFCGERLDRRRWGALRCPPAMHSGAGARLSAPQLRSATPAEPQHWQRCFH